jgi:hypothetical protein
VSGFANLRRSAYVLALAWFASQAWYFTFAPYGMTWGYAVITLAEATVFWRFSAASLVPRPLLLICSLMLCLHMVSTLTALNYWWSAFWMNRLFDLALLYVAGCAVYRLVRLHHKRRGAPAARPRSSEIFAAV